MSDRSKSSRHSHRDRERSYSKRNDSGSNRTYEADRWEKHSEKKKQSKSSKNDETLHRSIDSVKNRLKSSLKTAINDLSAKEDTGKNVGNDYDIDSFARQAEINRIEEPGFQPTTFKSGSGSSRSIITKKSHSDHDKAMYGPLWMKNELEKKQKQKEEDSQQQNGSGESAEGHITSRFPLSHERLSQNQELRDQQWKDLFIERRRIALEKFQ